MSDPLKVARRKIHQKMKIFRKKCTNHKEKCSTIPKPKANTNQKQATSVQNISKKKSLKTDFLSNQYLRGQLFFSKSFKSKPCRRGFVGRSPPLKTAKKKQKKGQQLQNARA
jgi:hypothetical protein